MEDDESGYAVSTAGGGINPFGDVPPPPVSANPFAAVPPAGDTRSPADDPFNPVKPSASNPFEPPEKQPSKSLTGSSDSLTSLSSTLSGSMKLSSKKSTSRIFEDLSQRRFAIWTVARGQEAPHKPDFQDYVRRTSRHGAGTKGEVVLQPTQCCGWLEKKGGFRKNWTKRWFVLDIIAQSLNYYEDNECKKLKGQIDITKVQNAKPDFSDKLGQKLLVATPERTFHINAPSCEAMEIWTVILNSIASDDAVVKDLLRKAAKRVAEGSTGPLRRKSSVGTPSRDSGHFDNPLRRDSAPP